MGSFRILSINDIQRHDPSVRLLHYYYSSVWFLRSSCSLSFRCMTHTSVSSIVVDVTNPFSIRSVNGIRKYASYVHLHPLSFVCMTHSFVLSSLIPRMNSCNFSMLIFILCHSFFSIGILRHDSSVCPLHYHSVAWRIPLFYPLSLI